uniref:Uncharacterized protein n=1 Tax=Tanacetum cinerariifolium TaxID=118510 RepID=A0A6L2N2D7_TANCI|nr:hypothetical protein [Tanacetum cinerariifolium]
MMSGESYGSAVLINNLDTGNPLQIHANDNSSTTRIPFKLTRTENYRIWASAMKLALQTRNKYSFVDGSCLKNAYSTSDVSSLVYSENATNVWKELVSTYDKVDGFVIFNLLQKNNNVKQGGTFVADYYHRLNSLWREFDALTKLSKCVCEVKCSCDASKELSLHQDPLPEVKDAYTTLSREESHRGIPEIFSATELKMSSTSFVAKPVNNIIRSSTSVSSLGFTSEQMREFLSLINDNTTGRVRANMADSNQHLIVSTVGMFDVIDITSLKITRVYSNWTLATISKMLGHPFDHILSVLQSDLNITKNCFVPVCEVCHSAKKTRDPFPLCDHKAKSLGELIQLDIWGPYRVHSREGFKYFLTVSLCAHTPQQNGIAEKKHKHLLNVGVLCFKGEFLSGLGVFSNQMRCRHLVQGSSRQSKFPAKLNDCVISSSSVKPSCYEDAMHDTNWIDDMNNEIEALNRNNTWTVCDLPFDRKAIGCKWIYKIKYKSTGEIDRYNARQWNAKLTTALVEHGFKQSKYDYSLYVKQSGESFVALLIYVDDIVITENNEKEINDFKTIIMSLIRNMRCEHGVMNSRVSGQQLQPSGFLQVYVSDNQTKVSLFTFVEYGCKNHGSPLISINSACDQAEFRRISLTRFRSCASRSQTGASQSRQITE